MSGRIRKYMKWLLPVLFVWYYGSILSNTHVHVENGVTIVHSHPFHGEGHQHSLAEFQLLHQLNTFYLQDGAIQELDVPVFVPAFVRNIQTPVADWVNHREILSFYLRAPPERVSC